MTQNQREDRLCIYSYDYVGGVGSSQSDPFWSQQWVQQAQISCGSNPPQSDQKLNSEFPTRSQNRFSNPPVTSVSSKNIRDKLDRRFSSDGTVPVIFVPQIESVCSWFRFASSVGIVPVSVVLDTSKNVKEMKSPISEGMDPEIPHPVISK